MARYKRRPPSPFGEATIEKMAAATLTALETKIADNGARPSIQVIDRGIATKLLADAIREVSILALEKGR